MSASATSVNTVPVATTQRDVDHVRQPGATLRPTVGGEQLPGRTPVPAQRGLGVDVLIQVRVEANRIVVGGQGGQLIEQVDRSELLERWALRPAHALARYSWISETAIEPSPTALATRLIERARTSPATSTPGTLVSSG